MIVTGQALQFFDRKISERIRPDHLADLRYRMVAGNQVLLRVYVSTVIAGIEKRGRCYPHMNLSGSGIPQESDNPFAGCSAHDGVVDQYNALALYSLADWREFDTDLIGPRARRNECAADIFVFDQTDPIRNP